MSPSMPPLLSNQSSLPNSSQLGVAPAESLHGLGLLNLTPGKLLGILVLMKTKEETHLLHTPG